MKIPAPNRVAVYLTALAGLLTALSGPVANLDTTSTATVVAGLGGVVVVVFKWLEGWQKHEARSPAYAYDFTTGTTVPGVGEFATGTTVLDEDTPGDADATPAIPGTDALPPGVPPDGDDTVHAGPAA